jgi:hypothetical protein
MTAHRHFIVTISPTIPTWQNKEYFACFYAKDRADAIKQARADYRAAWQDWGQAPAKYAARLRTEADMDIES